MVEQRNSTMQRTSPTRRRGRLPSEVAVGYLRRSTDRQEQSIPDQKKAIQRYAAENGLDLRRFLIDDAISGTSADRRPGFLQMVTEAQQKRSPYTFVVYDVKRFGRLDNDEAGYYRHISGSGRSWSQDARVRHPYSVAPRSFRLIPPVA